MTLAVEGTEVTSWSVGMTLTIPAAATGAIFSFSTSDDGGPGETSVMTIGGIVCPQLGFDISSGAVTNGGSMWWVDDFRARVSDVLSWTLNEGGLGTLAVVYFSGNVPLTRDVNPYTDTGFGLSGSGTVHQTSAATAPLPAGGNQLAFCHRNQRGYSEVTTGTALYGGDPSDHAAGYDLGAADEAVDVGIFASGQFWGWTLGATIYESVVFPTVSPAPIIDAIVLNPGTLAHSGPVKLTGQRARRLEIVLNPGRLGTVTQRQVALVGGVETPEMTVDGTEGATLTQHLKSPPTWEDPAAHVHSRRWVPMVWRPDPVGAPDDWQLLHADDGSVMMTWVED